jgi:hypothetical protein
LLHGIYHSYRYDLGITSVMPVASGCLTRKKNKAVPGCLSAMPGCFC